MLSSGVLTSPVVDPVGRITPTWLRFLRSRSGAEDLLTPGLVQTPLVEQDALMSTTWQTFFTDAGVPVPSGLATTPLVGRDRWLTPVWERFFRRY